MRPEPISTFPVTGRGDSALKVANRPNFGLAGPLTETVLLGNTRCDGIEGEDELPEPATIRKLVSGHA